MKQLYVYLKACANLTAGRPIYQGLIWGGILPKFESPPLRFLAIITFSLVNFTIYFPSLLRKETISPDTECNGLKVTKLN